MHRSTRARRSRRAAAWALAWVCVGALGASAESGSLQAGHEIRGVVTASAEALISSQIEGRVIELPFRLGEAFEEGDTLVAFDCAGFEAELAAAKAESRSARRTHQNHKELAALSAIGALEVEISQAEAEKAQARVDVAEVQTRRCTIRAPYAGRVIASNVNVYESVRSNQELLRILDDGQLEVELIVPSRWVRWLESGTEFRFHVDETDEEIPAHVVRIAAAADPVSQTIRIEAEFPGDTGRMLAGMSGTALFAPPETAVPAEQAP